MFDKKPPMSLPIPSDELSYDEYYHAASTRAASIIEKIIAGHRPMMNDLNMFSELDSSVMNPPTAWAKRIANSLQAWVDGVKADYSESGNDIGFYILNFTVREAGDRATVRFSYTAPLKR